jgi:UDP-N-acetylmuramoyl-L-alanyl-D-glutamate--2,6-diaminopimelate ligase
VLNHDDEWARRIPVAAETKVIWYGRGRAADVRAERVRSDFSGVRFEAVWEGEHREIASSMVGGINVSNILAALATGVSYGFGADDLVRGIEQCRATPGRFEQISEGQPFLVIVDYAHTDDAIRNVVAAARHLRPKRLITLFGCGGDRDRNKRPLMGEAAAAGSDIVVLTSDNPRSEDPVAIMNDALVGLRRHEVELHLEPDRRRAIQIALSAANEGDIVLLLGKGHESVQVVGDKKIPFDDARVAREMLRGFGYEGAKS